MDAEFKGDSLRMRIAKKHSVIAEDMWNGYRRTKFDFYGREAWVVEPSIEPAENSPWTWTMQCADTDVERTGVLELLKRGFHHVTIDLFDAKMNNEGLKAATKFQKFLVEELGLAPKANLIGISWGGFFATRYAATHPANVAKMYLDAPLLNFECFTHDLGLWTGLKPSSGTWADSAEMPINLAEKIAVAKIPVLLLYGGEDQTVLPSHNSEIFIRRFKTAGGSIKVEARKCYGHNPHGFDPGKQAPIRDFFTAR